MSNITFVIIKIIINKTLYLFRFSRTYIKFVVLVKYITKVQKRSKHIPVSVFFFFCSNSIVLFPRQFHLICDFYC